MKTKANTKTPRRVSDTLDELVGTEFVLRKDWDAMETHRVAFCRMNSPFYKGEKWAARRGSFCLTRAGDWEYEPMPSSRDDEFYARCRFDSLEQAVETFKSSNNAPHWHNRSTMGRGG